MHRKDIRCAEEQFFKQLIQLRPKRVDCTKTSEHMSLKAGIVMKSPLVSSS